MSLKEFFTIKTPAQRQREQEEYNRWAFPYGLEQKEAVSRLLSVLLPEEGKMAMAVFLIGKEAYWKNQRIKDAASAMAFQLPGKHRKKLYTYLALVLADAQVDEGLCYPDVQALRQQARQLEECL